VLVKAGVRVDKRSRRVLAAPASAVPLAADVSEPLADILRVMGRDSDNFIAEMLLKQLGEAIGDGGTTAAGARVVVETLREAGVPLDGVRVADGSGLSALDRMTAETLVAILRVGESDPAIRGPFLDSLAVAGVDGTLRHRLQSRPARSRVIAKTGTTNRASALAGFVRDRWVFAVVQNGRPVSSFWARRAQDRFATVLARS
jgi:PBP4 family serine-type D-alanyl-D-alanine carboxypeptidase